MSDVSSWTTSAASNNSAPPDGWPEGQLPSTVNDCAREMMAAVRRWYIDAEWINFGYPGVRQTNNSFIVSVTATEEYSPGRRLKMVDGGVTILGEVLASSVAAGNTTVTVSSSNLSASLSTVSVGILNPRVQSVPITSVGMVRGLKATNTAAVNLFSISSVSTVLFDKTGFTSLPTARQFRTAALSTMTVDIGQAQAGSEAGKRDQATSFSNRDIHFYMIDGNGPVSALASGSGPQSFTAVAMPTGYTHLCYLWSQKMTGTSLTEVFVRNDTVFYQTRQILDASISATSELTLTSTSVVPQIASSVIVHVGASTELSATDSVAFQLGYLSSIIYFPLQFSVPGGLGGTRPTGSQNQNTQVELPNTSGKVFVLWSNAASAIKAIGNVSVVGYKVPN